MNKAGKLITNEIKLFKQKQFDGSCVIVQMDPNACDTCDYRCTKECGGHKQHSGECPQYIDEGKDND